MPLMRALTDININSMQIPINRVAHIYDETVDKFIDTNLVSFDKSHIETALRMNQDVIDVCGGYVAEVFQGNPDDLLLSMDQPETLPETVTEQHSESEQTKTDTEPKTVKK